MPAFKEKDGTWSCSFHYRDWTGTNKRKHKRGFKTKREAVEFEAQFKLSGNYFNLSCKVILHLVIDEVYST